MDNYALDGKIVARAAKGRRAMLAIVLGSSLAMLGAGAMSLAVFTDSDTNGATWTTGTIILGVSPTTVFTPGVVMPGDSGQQTVTVANTGTGALRYAMSSVATNADTKDLRSQLTLTIDAGACGATTGIDLQRHAPGRRVRQQRAGCGRRVIAPSPPAPASSSASPGTCR